MSTVEVDGKIGPNVAITDVSFTNIRSFTFNDSAILELTDTNGKVTQIDISAAATVTVTVVAAGNYTVNIDN